MQAPEGAKLFGHTAEWIVESPSGGTAISSLPNFTDVVFKSAICLTEHDPNTGHPYAEGPGLEDSFTNTVNITDPSGKVLTKVIKDPNAPDSCTIQYIGPQYTGT